jgi:hypothetical protein
VRECAYSFRRDESCNVDHLALMNLGSVSVRKARKERMSGYTLNKKQDDEVYSRQIRRVRLNPFTERRKR